MKSSRKKKKTELNFVQKKIVNFDGPAAILPHFLKIRFKVTHAHSNEPQPYGHQRDQKTKQNPTLK